MRWRSKLGVAFLLATLVAAACARRSVRRTAPVVALGTADSIVRVAISVGASSSRFSSTTSLSIADSRSGTVQGSSRPGEEWMARPAGDDGIELTRTGARAIVVRGGSATLRTEDPDGFVLLDGRRYRGTLTIWREDDKLVVVNNIGVENYLNGVVPLEIGTRRASEREAIAAQAIAARSFTYARVATRRRDTTRRYDLLADVSDQAYSGYDFEGELTSEQVRATNGLVLKSGDRVIEAVYSSSCGGSTADASDVWSGGGASYLKGVSDSAPGGRAYCEIAPRYSWTASLDSADLVASIDMYLRNYAPVNGRINSVSAISVAAARGTGRARTLTVSTNAGRHEVVGDKIRFVLRPRSGEILRSTMFSVVSAPPGALRLEMRGTGFGHGVGMCQWGAIGRARAGQDFRKILLTYYSGAKIERIDMK